jgi:hypothetical protein
MSLLSERQKELVSLIVSECESVKDITVVLKQLFAGTLEQMIESEIPIVTAESTVLKTADAKQPKAKCPQTAGISAYENHPANGWFPPRL